VIFVVIKKDWNDRGFIEFASEELMNNWYKAYGKYYTDVKLLKCEVLEEKRYISEHIGTQM
jgi:hypothetical protein